MNEYDPARINRRYMELHRQMVSYMTGGLRGYWGRVSLWIAHQSTMATFWVLSCISILELPMLLPVAGFTAILAGALYLLAWALFGFPQGQGRPPGGAR